MLVLAAAATARAVSTVAPEILRALIVILAIAFVLSLELGR